MSIITDNRGSSYRIARFGNIATVNNVTYKAKQYARISNGYFAMKHSGNTSETSWRYQYGSSSNDSVLIKCEIPSTVTNAYFYGFYTNENAQMWIGKVGTKIKWAMGRTEREMDYQSGVHVYGFDSAGYAVYDGARIGNSMRESGYSASRDDIVIGARRNGDEFEYATVDIYEVVLLAYRKSTMASRDEAHLYAASGDGTNPVLFETRKDSTIYGVKSFTAASGGSGSVGGDVTYGVQLHDLKYMTKSGYHDLVALMCEDWEQQASADADPAYTLTGPNSATFKSAFLLKGANPNASTGSVSMPVPSGWIHEGETGGVTPPSRPMTEGYIGELIAGRTPKWKLWVDGVNLGKRVKDVGGTYQFLYNIFMPPNGKQMPCLELFEGYSDAASVNWPPVLQIPNSSITAEFHNSLMCQCTESQLITETIASGQTLNTNAHYRVFNFANSNEVASIKFRLGNLPCWNMTPAEIYALEPQGVNLIFGMACTVEHLIYGGSGYSVVAMAYKQTEQDKGSLSSDISKQLMPLSSSSDTATVNMFKKGLTADGTGEADYGIYITGELETLLYRELVQGNVTARARLSAIRDSQTYGKTISGDTEFPTTDGLVFADHILGYVSASITGKIDTKIDGSASSSSSDKYRSLLMCNSVTYNNVDYTVYPVATGLSSGVTLSSRIANKSYESGGSSYTGDFFAFNFSLLNGSNVLATNTTGFNRLIAVIEVTYKNSSTYNKFVDLMLVTKSGDTKDSIADPTASGEPWPQTYMTHPTTSAQYMPNNSSVPSYCFTAWKLINTNKSGGPSQSFPAESSTKIWVGHYATMKPVWFTNGTYQYTPDQWKVDFGSTRGYILIDETKRELTGNISWLEIDFTSWNSSNQKSAYNVSSSRTITVRGYNGSINANSEPELETLTTITVTSGNTLSGLSCSATNSYQAEIVPGGKVPLGPDGQYPLTGIYGYRLRVLPPSGTTWKGVLAVTFN